MIWIQFVICAALIIFLGSLLSRYGDVIAEKTGLGGVWIGAILIAGVTSLPELTSGVSAVVWLKQPDLAAGSILGSCLFNLVLIAVMDIVYQPGPILSEVEDSHLLSAGLGVILFSIVAIAVLFGQTLGVKTILGMSVFSLLILVAYLIGARLIARFEQRRYAEVLKKEAVQYNYENISSRKAYGIFILASLGIIAAGIWLSFIGDQISTSTGLSRSFVGNLFLAFSTSLPEVAVSVAAVRLGALDIAIGNVLGSNLFNILILTIFDIANGRADFWKGLSNGNGIAAIMTILMTGIVIVSIVYRASPKFKRRINWDGWLLIGSYLVTMLILYLIK